MDENTEKERPLWPEFWSIGELRAKRAGMDRRYWAAQYQQKPTDDEGALIKRESWRLWTQPEPPKCSYIIQSWDTAYLAKETADYNACTTWGVFTRTDERGKEQNNIMLLNAFKARMEFPELKKTALKHYKEWEPDTCIIEAKAAGLPLIQEFRLIGVPVQDFTPSRGNDKTARVNTVADMFASGLIWCPDRAWARDVQDECAAFPNGDHDDYVDTVTAALIRFRRGGFITLPDEVQDDDRPRYVKNNALYRVTG
jgi:predicted phage terminase large subunit-like protein